MLIRKSLLWKLALYFLLFGALLGATGYVLNDFEVVSISFKVFIGVLGAFVVLFWMAVYASFLRPMRSILHEVECLLTGRKYKRIFTTRVDEIGVMSKFFNEVTSNLQKISGNIVEEKRLSGELGLAAEIQNNILPKSNPEISGLGIEIKTRSAAETGGDSFDFIKKGDRTFIYVGDVTGHGVPAALVMTMVHALMRVFSESFNSAYDIVVQTNKHLKQHISSTMFMTMIMLCWDNANKKLTYVGAGHEYLMVYRKQTGACEQIQAGGIALGMVPDNSKLVKELDLQLDNGDFLLLFTDGIVEGRNVAGEMYGVERLKTKFTQFAVQYSVSDIHKNIANDFAQFVGSANQEDDITLMVLQRTDDEVSSASTSKSTNW